jgi:hypothetical protein
MNPQMKNSDVRATSAGVLFWAVEGDVFVDVGATVAAMCISGEDEVTPAKVRRYRRKFKHARV